MIERFAHWELLLARRLAKPDRLDLWAERHGITPRRGVRALFMLFPLAIVMTNVSTSIEMSVGVPPRVVVRMALTQCGALLIPLAFVLLFVMRRCVWTWTAASLVALFAVPWVWFDALSVYAEVEMREVLARLGTGGCVYYSLAGVDVMFCLILFGALDRMAILTEREIAKQGPQRTQIQ